MQFNRDKVRKIVSEIFLCLERLEELKSLSEAEFLSDPHKIGSAKYNLIVAIEGIIDLCNHIIAKNAFRTPEDYADTFRVMAEKGAFDEEFTNTLIQMARFRNRLVHIYWEVDDKELQKVRNLGSNLNYTFYKPINSRLASGQALKLKPEVMKKSGQNRTGISIMAGSSKQ